MIEAMFSKSINECSDIQCFICPNECVIGEGRSGICRIRQNIDGKLQTIIADRCCSVNLDPIEKKPLYHFFPGSKILSLGTYGCNFSCTFCQNWSLSHIDSRHLTPKTIAKVAEKISPADALNIALNTRNKGNIGISYTYNEPTIWYEFVYETAKLIKNNGLYNVLVSNGYMNQEPLKKILPYIDAVNVDIKSIKPGFYKKYCRANLSPVLDYCRTAKDKALVEITNLVIPTLNDSEEDLTELVNWVSDNLGQDTPIHFSRYHPDFKMDIPATPFESLERAYSIAVRKLKYVYVGNIMNNPWDNTECPKCKKTVIKREYMGVIDHSLDSENRCLFCSEKINIIGNCKKSR